MMSRARLLCRLAGVLSITLLAPATSFAQDARWVDVAAALWRTRDGRARVAVGFSGTQPTPEDATASAVAQCVGAGGPNCQNFGPVRGCAYIVVGRTRGGVAYGVGGSPDAAINSIRSAGATSWQTPLGGCGN
jgi:Domain of unknown function (DUF4189)